MPAFGSTRSEVSLAPLGSGVFNNVPMDRPDIWCRLSDKEVATFISTVATVDVADSGQPLDELWDRIQSGHHGSDVEYGFRRQIGPRGTSHVLQVSEQMTADTLGFLTCVCGERGPA